VEEDVAILKFREVLIKKIIATLEMILFVCFGYQVKDFNWITQSSNGSSLPDPRKVCCPLHSFLVLHNLPAVLFAHITSTTNNESMDSEGQILVSLFV
jgi:hypothetical protein